MASIKSSAGVSSTSTDTQDVNKTVTLEDEQISKLPANSLASRIAQFVRLNTNALEVYSKISEAVFSDEETVSVKVLAQDGSSSTVTIPSFGYMANEIDRLNLNFENLSSFTGNDVRVQLADGSYQTIVKSELMKAADDITELATPTEFNVKSNYFFESFLNPLMYITLDVTGQLPVGTERVKVRRYLLDLSEEIHQNHFDNNFKGSNVVNYENFNQFLVDNNLPHTIDEELVDMPSRVLRYTGDFSVLSIVTDTDDMKNIYQLNKITYSDSSLDSADTLSLEVGDVLRINETNTRYQVAEINRAKSTCKVTLMDGTDIIKVGSNNLSIYKGFDTDLNVDINLGFDESLVVFMKGIDPNSKVEAKNWSNGIGLYTNDLSIIDQEGKFSTLADYYMQNVVDFGKFILSYQADNVPPSLFGIQPDPPVLDSRDFQVVQINEHLTNNSTFNNVQELHSNKEESISKLQGIDAQLKAKKDQISNTDYGNNEAQFSADKAEYNTLIQDRSVESSLFSSLVKDIKSNVTGEDLTEIKPKYRVRGFWDIPTPKNDVRTGDQQIVQFEIQYRYLTSGGGSSNLKTFKFGSGDSKKRATYSDWISQTGTPLTRELGPDGKFAWSSDSVEDADKININQLDVPIRFGESVELKIRSVSEAGWPNNPATSEWSDPITLAFPAALNSKLPIETIAEANLEDMAKVRMMEELTGLGVFDHVENSFNTTNQYFAHDAERIASGFYDDASNPVNLYNKLISMQETITSLQSQLNQTSGEINFKLIKPDGQDMAITMNGETTVMAGYYRDQVADLEVQKGAIVSQTYELVIENLNGGPLELSSLVPGARSGSMFSSGPMFNNGQDISDLVDNNVQYIQNGRYDYVPVMYPTGAPYQASQTNSQFIYNRLKGVDGAEFLYSDKDPDIDAVPNNPAMSNYEYRAKYNGVWNGSSNIGGNNDYIWKYQYDAIPNMPQVVGPERTIPLADVEDYENSIYVHKSHPLVGQLRTQPTEVTQDQTGLIWDCNSGVVNAIARQSKYASIMNQQAALYNNGNRGVKFGFQENDRFLLGGKSCGSYLFVNLPSEDHIYVGGDNQFAYYDLKQGATNQIRIPIVFQYRMTDFAGANNSGTGFIGGNPNGEDSNPYYVKTLGFDLKDKDGNMHTFDLKFTAWYKPLSFSNFNFGTFNFGNFNLNL